MRKYLPYAPAGMPGVWWEIVNFLPTRGGAYYPCNMFAVRTTGAAIASPGTTLRAWCALLSDDTAVRWIGTTTSLWLYDGVTTFTDRSKGGGYTNTATDWSFAQLGNDTIAVNRVDAVQRSTSGAAFADCAGSPPKARIAVSQQLQVLLFDLNDGAEKPDYFIACAPGNITDWSGAGASGPNPIWHRPGKIRAAIAFKDYVLVFKRSSVYKLTYTGTTYKWKVELIAIGRGAWGMHDVVNCGDCVIFNGPGGSWRFDGASFRPVTDYVGEIPQARGSFFSPISQNAHFVMASVTYVATGGFTEATPEVYAYNLVSDRWGIAANYDTGSGGAIGRSSTVAQIPMTGEPAALAAVVTPTVALPDLMWIITTDLTKTNQIYANTAYWGNGSQAGSSGAAVITGGVEGIGGDVMTEFSRLTPELTMSLRNLGSDPKPGNTELLLNVAIADCIDALNSNGGTSYSVTAQPSSTAQKRFELNVAGVAARFQMYLPGNSGYIEIQDYALDMKPGGTL